MYRRKLASVLIFLLFISLSMPVFSASVSGFVKQPSNRPAVGALVTFTCPGRDPFPETGFCIPEATAPTFAWGRLLLVVG